MQPSIKNSLYIINKLKQTLEMGFSLNESIELLLTSEKNKSAKSCLKNFNSMLNQGVSTIKALSCCFKHIFPKNLLYIQKIPKIDLFLSEIIKINTQKQAHKKFAYQQLRYPIALCISLFITMVIASKIIIPNNIHFLNDNQLPIPNVLMVIINPYFKSTVIKFFILIVIFSLGTYLLAYKRKIKIALLNPFLRPLDLLWCIGMLLKSGLSANEAINSIHIGSNNPSLKNWKACWLDINQSGNFFDNIGKFFELTQYEIALLTHGTRSKNLGKNILFLHHYLNNEKQEMIKSIITFIQPTLLISQGILIILLAYLCVMPILTGLARIIGI